MKSNIRNSQNSNIDIVCVSDVNYLPHLAALLSSIECNSKFESKRVHILHDGISIDSQKQVSDLFHHMLLIWYPVNDHVALGLSPLLQISRATYLRLIIDEVLDKSIKRLIYLDIDMIVTTSLRPLWEHNFDGFACAAVIDPGVNSGIFARKHSLEGQGAYFNAGMLLLDMEKIRSGKVLSDALNLLLQDQSRYEYADQDVLNIVLWGNCKVIDATWNFQREFLYDKLSNWCRYSDRTYKLPAVVHFTESVKPWKSTEWHPYAWLYWKYLFKTPYANFLMHREGISYYNIVRMFFKFLLNKNLCKK